MNVSVINRNKTMKKIILSFSLLVCLQLASANKENIPLNNSSTRDSVKFDFQKNMMLALLRIEHYNARLKNFEIFNYKTALNDLGSILKWAMQIDDQELISDLECTIEKIEESTKPVNSLSKKAIAGVSATEIPKRYSDFLQEYNSKRANIIDDSETEE